MLVLTAHDELRDGLGSLSQGLPRLVSCVHHVTRAANENCPVCPLQGFKVSHPICFKESRIREAAQRGAAKTGAMRRAMLAEFRRRCFLPSNLQEMGETGMKWE